MKKSKLTEEDIINKWLGDYHNTNLSEVKKLHPDWEADPEKHTQDFYNTYKVTQEQHDQWHEWMVRTLAKETGMSLKFIKRKSWGVYLNTVSNVSKL